MGDHRPKVVVIAGATASGKSSLAVELALHFGGEIVNADSLQVYRGMDIGTAKPSIAERKGIPHHLLDVVDPDQDFNAAIYCSHATPLLKDISARKKMSFLVGGTGLYIKSLLGGLLECPRPDPKLREKLHRDCEELGPVFLHEKLKEQDSESASRIHPNDRIRVIRALEVIQLTHQPLSELRTKHGFRERPFHALKIFIQTEREQLYTQINRRALAMIESGLVRETETLMENGYVPELKAMQSIGYRHMVRYLEGTWDLDEAIGQLQRDTRRYAKRQQTWFRADPEMIPVQPEDVGDIIKRIKAFQSDTS